MQKDFYGDIAKRTGGDIYIGVVGPVRTGKSTFIGQLMKNLVIPNIDDESRKERASLELPQSAGGRTIQTSEPKFIPEKAVDITLHDEVHLRVRAVDCVGYIVPDALGYMEQNAPRMVKTPWFEEEIPFGMAAEVGTRKVITDHSTVGIVVTTDGSITDIPRKQYEECEERVINELKEINKPFVILLNSTSPESPAAKRLAEEMRKKYKAAVIPVSCPDLSEDDIREILMELLYAFPLREVQIHTAGWLSGLECTHWLREAVFSAIRKTAKEMKAVRDVKAFEKLPELCEYIENISFMETDLGTGSAKVSVSVSPSLFYTILGEKTGLDIHSDGELMSILTELCEMKKKYMRFAPALDEAMSTGYGIVMPELSEMSLEEPEIIKQGGKYGVRLKASAPSIHLMKATINTAVSPIVGTEKQSEELIMYLFDGFEDDSTKIWTSNIFGKSLQDLVGEGLRAKLGKMPIGARMKLQETLERVINDGCGGLICFIL